MKKICGTLLFFGLSIFAFSQSLTDYSTDYSDNKDTDMSDLSLIRSINDFNQKGFNEKEIDYLIANLISKNIDVYSVECPYNTKKLQYLGFVSPDSLNVFPANYFANNYKEASNKQYIYKYDIFYISVPDNSRISALNVFFTLRALNIIKYKYQNAYQKLIQETLYFPYKSFLNTVVNNKLANVKYLNSNKCFFILFNEYPIGIAQGVTAYATTTRSWIKDTSIYVSENFPIITIHSKKLLGNDLNYGSGSIYKTTSPSTNYQLYMRDGLIETLTHELIHRYIDANYSVDVLTNKLFNSEGRKKSDPNLISLEEAIVRYTTVNYFSAAGGISPEMVFFENVEADLNCVDLKVKNKLAEYMKNVNEWKGTRETDIYRLFQIPIWHDQ